MRDKTVPRRALGLLWLATCTLAYRQPLLARRQQLAGASGQGRHHPSRAFSMLAVSPLDGGNDMCDDVCMLPVTDEVLDDAGENARETLPFDTALALAPFVIPAGAYLLWDDVARSTRAISNMLNNNWFSVDGGMYQIAILTPSINGIVVPSLSFALGTLCATTIGQLKQRQVELRECINLEACELNLLRASIAEMPLLDSSVRTQLLTYAREYVTRLIAESRADTRIKRVERAGVADNELVGLLAVLYGAAAGSSIPQHFIDSSTASVRALNGHRSRRLAALASTFPTVHWVVLVLCATSIIVLFLIESDQEVLRFLDSVQLRVIFTFLVGCFVGIASVILDLINPFRGMSRADGATFQLFTIRASLTYELCRERAAECTDATGSKPKASS